MRKILFSFITIVLILAFGCLALGNSGFPIPDTFCEPSVRYENIKIKYGDTLWDIAGAFRGKEQQTADFVEEIKEFNHLKNDSIYAGQHLIIPIRQESR